MKTYRIFYNHEGEGAAADIHCQDIAGRDQAEEWMDTALLCGVNIFRLDVIE